MAAPALPQSSTTSISPASRARWAATPSASPIRNALGPAIKTAIAARKPAVIDVVTSLNDITFADITSPLAKVAAKVRR